MKKFLSHSELKVLSETCLYAFTVSGSNEPKQRCSPTATNGETTATFTTTPPATPAWSICDCWLEKIHMLCSAEHKCDNPQYRITRSRQAT